ncbi:MAG: hypothetical protein M1818_004786 [Claussenomyces sp. TS43310]|nr:MAG: hypothetical protein M1818_004786 [Claussenomyces sp. TS43310]
MTLSFAIRLLPPDVAESASASVAELINRAYGAADAEGAFWTIPNKPRTTAPAMAALISASEVLAAYSPELEVVGCVRLQRVDARTASLGMLAVGPGARGKGVGRDLVAAAEATARQRGYGVMQLEILRPTAGTHPGKEMLARWYRKLGYALVGVETPAEFVPGMEKLLACECEFLVYRKDLA